MKFSKPLLPPKIQNIIDYLHCGLYFVLGFMLLIFFHIMVGYIITQGYYLLRNEGIQNYQMKDYVELFIVHLVLIKGLTKTVEFFER